MFEFSGGRGAMRIFFIDHKVPGESRFSDNKPTLVMDLS